MSLIEVKLRPSGPWRVGHRAGDRERVDVVYHSDALYSAVTHAMRALGWLEEWLEATANAPGDPAVRFSSLFPFMGKTRLVAPPKSAWPPALTGKLYLQGARLIPLEIVKSGVVDESRWTVDGESECMIPVGSAAPFRVSMRSAAAVDRFTGIAEPHRTACLEFASNAGWWGVFSVSDHVWESRVKSALRLLADSGFGGERSRGWGRAGEPHFSEAALLFAPAGAEKCWWLLSLYSPHEQDAVDWSRSDYTTAVLGGWTDSPSGTGAKKQVRMIEEGSVLAANSLRGRAVDVAPDAFPHPVYRAGFALAMPAPVEILLRAPASTEVRQTSPPVDLTPVSIVEQSGGESEAGRAEPAQLPDSALEPVASQPDKTEAAPEPESQVEPEPDIARTEPASLPDSAPEPATSQPDKAEPAPEPESHLEPEPDIARTEPAPLPDSAPEPATSQPDKAASEPDTVHAEPALSPESAPEPAASQPDKAESASEPESPAKPETSPSDEPVAKADEAELPDEEPKPPVPHKSDEVAE